MRLVGWGRGRDRGREVGAFWANSFHNTPLSVRICILFRMAVVFEIVLFNHVTYVLLHTLARKKK